MKTKSSLRAAILAGSIAALLAAPAAQAATYYWDVNGVTAGFSTVVGGWNGTNAFWNNQVTGTGGTPTATVGSTDDLNIVAATTNTGTITLTGARAASSITFASGVGAVTMSGGTLALGGTGASQGIFNNSASAQVISTAITLASASTINNSGAGTLSIGGTVGGTLALNGFALTFSGTGTTTFEGSASNVISGAGGIIKNGTGSLILDAGAPNPLHLFTGGIVVNGGVVKFQTGTNVTGRGNVTLNGGYLSARFNSPATWAGGLGTGTTAIQILGGTSGFSGEGATNSTFTIGTALSVLKWGASGENGALGFFNPTVLLLGGDAAGTNANGKGTLANGIDLNGTTRTITALAANGDGALNTGMTITGVISTSIGTAGIIKTGPGNISFGGASVNTYNGGTTISGGTLTINSASSLGTNVNTNNVSLAAGTRLNLSAAGNTGANQTITLTSTASSLSVLALGYNGIPNAAIAQADTNGAVIAINAVVGYNQNLSTLLSGNNYFLGGIGTTTTFTGAAANIAVGAGSLYRLGGGGGTISFNTANLFTSTNAVQIGSTATNGTGTVVFGASQDFTGAATVISGSTLSLTASQAFTNTLTVNSGATFNTSNTISVASPISNAGTMTVGGATTFAGLVSTSSGMTLSSTATQTFNGGLTLTSGTVNFASGTTAIAGSGLLTIGTSTLRGNGTLNIANNVMLNAGSNLSLDRPSGSVPNINFNGNVELAGAATITSGISTTSANVAFNGDISDPGGNFLLTLGGTNFSQTFTFAGNNSWSGGLTTGSANTVTVNINSPTAVGTGTLTLAGSIINNTFGSAITLSTNNVLALNANFTFTGTQSLDLGTGNTTLSATRTIIVTANTLTLGGTISAGAVGFIKQGAGTLALGGVNNTTGANTITAGVLRLNNASALVSTTGNINLNGGLLGLGAADETFSVSGGVGTGAGQVQWTASSGFTAYGATRTVTIGTAGTSINWTTTSFIGAGNSLLLSSTDSDATIIFNKEISFAGGGRTINVANGSAAIDAKLPQQLTGGTGGNSPFTKAGTGTLSLTAQSTYNGATNITGGTLMLGDGTGNTGGLSSASTSVVVSTGATLAVNRTGAVSQGASSPLGNSAIISGAGGFTQAGSGTTTLSLANTYTGNTTVSAGILAIASTGSLGNTAIAVTGTSTFSVTPGAGTVNLGNSSTAGAGATLNLGSGTTFSMVDATAGGTTNLVQEGTFASNALTLNTATLNFELGGATADNLAVTGALATASVTGVNTINLTPVAALAAGTYNLITTANGAGGLDTGGTFRFANGASTAALFFGGTAYAVNLNNAANIESVTVGESASAMTWTGQTAGNGATDASWNTTGSTNWAVGTTPVAFSNGNPVTFQDTNTVAAGNVAAPSLAVVIQAGGVSPGSTTFTNSAVDYTVSNASGVIGIAGTGSLTKSGSGTVTLSGANTYTGITTVSAGTLTLSGNRTVASGGYTVSGTGTQTLNIQAGTYGVGASFIVGNTGGTATVNHSAGTISSVGGSGLIMGNGTVAGTTAIYNLSGGALTAANIIMGTNAGFSAASPNTSTIAVSGTGALTATTLRIGRYDVAGNINTTNTFTQTAGTVTLTTMGLGGNSGNATASAGPVITTLSLTGGTFSATHFASLSAGGDASALNANSSFITIGGTAQVTLGAIPNAKGLNSTATITFDSTTGGGGFLAPVAANANYMPAGTFTHAYLTANGANFNVGSGKDITVGQALKDATSPAAAGTLTKTGVGTLTLAGVNTYTGATTISAGTLSVGLTANLGAAASNLVFDGGTLRVTGTGLTNFSGIGHSVSFNATKTVGLDIDSSAHTFTVDQVLNQTSGGFTKLGAGTAILNLANTYTGATAVNAGTLTLAFGGVAADIISTSSALTMGGGTLQLTGTGTQTVNGLTTTAGTVSNILLAANETLTLGALTSAGASSFLNFNTVAGGANATTPAIGTGIVVLTGQTAGNVINTGFTVTDGGGYGLATVNGSDQVIRLTGGALLPATGATSGIDYLVDNNAGGAGAAGSSSLLITAVSEAARSITVDTTAASGVLTLDTGVVLSNNTWNFGGTGSNTYQITGSAGGAGLNSVASSDTISINNSNTGTVTFASPILANGVNNVFVGGTGTTVFSGTNTYTGTTTINGGTLNANSTDALGTGVAGNTLIFTGGTLQASGTITSPSTRLVTLTSTGVVDTNGNIVSFAGVASGAGGLTKNGAGTLTFSAFNTFTGPITINGGTLEFSATGLGTLYGSTQININGASILRISSTVNNQDIYNGRNYTFDSVGGGSILVSTGNYNAISTPFSITTNGGAANTIGLITTSGAFGFNIGATVATFNVALGSDATSDLTVTPIIANTGSILKTGAGRLTFTGANTYTGSTTINAGTLRVSGGSAIVNTGLITLVNVAGATFQVVGSETIGALAGGGATGGAVSIDASQTLTLSSGTQTYAGTVSGAGTLTSSGATQTLNGALSHGAGVNVTTGVLTLGSSANSYTGTTLISLAPAGIIVTANGALGAIGAGNGTTVTGNGASTASALGFSGGINYSTAETITGSGVGHVGSVAGFIDTQRGFIQSVSGSNTFAGDIVVDAGGISRIGTQDGAQLTLSGVITQASGNILFRAGSNAGDFVTLSNAGNSFGANSTVFTGATVGNYAGVRLGITNGLPTNLTISGLTGTNGSALDLAGFNQTLNGLITGVGGLSIINMNTGTPSTLTLNPTADKSSSNTLILGGGGLEVINVVKNGTFSQTLSGANTYTGATTVQAGSLVAGANAPAAAAGPFGNASSALVLGNGSTLVGDAPTLLINGAFTVGRDITVGSLANAAAYNATIGGSNASGTSSFTGNITLDTTAANYTATLQAATGGTVDFNTGTWVTNNKAIAIGSSGNTGTVQLSNAIATSGGISVNFGTLALNSAFTLGDMTVSSGTALSGTGSVAGTTGVTSGTVNGAGLVLTGLATFNSTGSILSGTVTATAGVSLAGAAALANSATATGGIAVGAGTLTGTGGSFSAASTLNGGIINLTSGSFGSTLGVTGGNWDGAGSVTGLVTSSSGTFNIGSGANLTANGNLNVTGGSLSGTDATSMLTGSLNYTSTTGSNFGGVIAGSGKTVTMNAASTTLTLSGTNTYTGLTDVQLGTLALSGGAAIANTGAVNVAAVAGATLLVSASETIGSLSGGSGANGAVTLGANTLTVGDASTTTFGGTITGTATTGTLVKQGAGVLNLAPGAVLTFDTLTANAGTLNVNSALGTGTGTGVVAVNTAGTKLRFGSVSQTLSSLTIGAGSTVIFTSGVASGAFSGGGKSPSLGGSAVVPEPGTLGLLLVGALGVLGRRRRQA